MSSNEMPTSVNESFCYIGGGGRQAQHTQTFARHQAVVPGPLCNVSATHRYFQESFPYQSQSNLCSRKKECVLE